MGSDHDFFVVTVTGQQEAFRTDLSWLPDHQRIAFWFRKSPHALRAVFDSGHLLEFVLFDEAIWRAERKPPVELAFAGVTW